MEAEGALSIWGPPYPGVSRATLGLFWSRCAHVQHLQEARAVSGLPVLPRTQRGRLSLLPAPPKRPPPQLVLTLLPLGVSLLLLPL